MTLFSDILQRDRKREGLRLARAAWLLGVSVPELRELEAGTAYPSSDVYLRLGELYEWRLAFCAGNLTKWPPDDALVFASRSGLP